MKITHRVNLRASNEQICHLKHLGMHVERVGAGLVVFLVHEGSSAWPAVAALIDQWKANDLVTTEFSKRELGEARCLIVTAWHHGYPQPEDDFRSVTYDDSDYCLACGIGGKQRGPFRMLREPKWGAKHLLQLNWVLDELFTTPETWEAVFRPFGIESIPVINHKSGTTLRSVVQLDIRALATSKISPDAFVADSCATCNRGKLQPIARGLFPHVEIPKTLHLAKTREYFGSGASAWRAMIISSALYESIRARGSKGASFQVVAGA
jgi:hypothetical protein